MLLNSLDLYPKNGNLIVSRENPAGYEITRDETRIKIDFVPDNQLIIYSCFQKYLDECLTVRLVTSLRGTYSIVINYRKSIVSTSYKQYKVTKSYYLLKLATLKPINLNNYFTKNGNFDEKIPLKKRVNHLQNYANLLEER